MRYEPISNVISRSGFPALSSDNIEDIFRTGSSGQYTFSRDAKAILIANSINASSGARVSLATDCLDTLVDTRGHAYYPAYNAGTIWWIEAVAGCTLTISGSTSATDAFLIHVD